MSSIKRSPLVLSILFFTSLIALVGTISFWKVHYDNVQLQTALEKEGIITKGYVISKDKTTNRKLNSSNFKWQYMDDYTLSFHYEHSGQAAVNKLSLAYQLKKDSLEQLTNTPQSLGKISLQSTVGQPLFDQVQSGSALSIIYLYQQPNSAKIIYPEGVIAMPSLLVFCILSFVFLLATLGMLFYFWRTGKTF